MKRILVIGAAGQLARALTELADTMSDEDPKTELAFVSRGRPMLDLLDHPTILTAFDDVRPDLVINAAARG